MAIIPSETVQQILDATDIVELIQGYFPLKRAGTAFVAICPFHNERSPSFNVNPQRQIFHCFGCHVGGDAIKFVMLYENLVFTEASRKLADRAGIRIVEEAYDPKEEARRKSKGDLMRLQRSAAEWFHRLLFRSPLAQPARDYLTSRGLSMETSRLWKFGYAPSDSRDFMDWARGEGYSVNQLVEGGLAKWRDENRPGQGAYAFFRHRLMFPVNDPQGETIAFSGRVLSAEQGGGKYVNSPETVLFNKSRTFFGFDRSKRAILREKRAIICEGQLDLVAAHGAGIENVVAPLGTAFTPDHAKILKRHTEEVVLCFDSDTAGLNAASKAFRVLAPMGILVRLALLPPGEDPDSLIRKQGAGALREILDAAPEFFEFQIDRQGGGLDQGSLRDRLAFARDLSADIALVDDKMLQDSLISRVTIRLGVGEDDVRKLVRDAAAAKLRAEKATHRREMMRSRSDSPAAASSGEVPPGGAPGPASTVIQNRSVRLLCRALLTDRGVREAIVSGPPPEFFDALPETELLAWLWESDYDPENAASVNALLGRLPEAGRATLLRLLAEESAAMTPDLARNCLSSLRRQSIQREIAVAKARLGTRDLPESEVTRLAKVILDLRGRLNEC